MSRSHRASRFAIAVVAASVLVLPACGSAVDDAAREVAAATGHAADHQGTDDGTQGDPAQHHGSAAHNGPVVGDPVEIGARSAAARITVVVVRPASTAAGGSRVAWEAEIIVDGRTGSWPISSEYFHVSTLDGRTVTTTPGSLEGSFGTTVVREGETARGVARFDLPPGQRISSITATLPLGAQLATWTVE